MFEPGLIAKTAQEFDAEKFGGILEEIVGSLPAFSSELLLIGFVLAIFLLDLMLPLRASKHLAWVAVLGCSLPAMSGGHAESGHTLFQGMLASDSFAGFFKQFFLLGAIPVIFLSYVSNQFEGRRMGEYYGILLSAVLGAIQIGRAHV